MLWGNPAVLLALLAGQTWAEAGQAMKLGTRAVVGDLAVYVLLDADGDQVALPCTERLFTEREAARVAGTGVVPVVSLRGRPEVRVAGFASVAGPPLAGRWAPVEIKAAPPPTAPPPTAPPPVPPPATPTLEATPPAAAPMATAAPAVVPDTPVAAAPAPAPAPAEDPPEDDLDALLASLAAEPPPTPADETEADLDALLASLK